MKLTPSASYSLIIGDTKMIIIEKHAEFHVRAKKESTTKPRARGYNFSYPVLNTIEITNILLFGGSIIIDIERFGKSKWTFDLGKSELTIERKNKVETHTIVDVEELCDEMLKYHRENSQELTEKNLRTLERKSASKIGNQNARKYQANTTSNEQENQPSEGVGILNQHGCETVQNEEVNPYKMAGKTKSDYGYDFLRFNKEEGKPEISSGQMKKMWEELAGS